MKDAGIQYEVGDFIFAQFLLSFSFGCLQELLFPVCCRMLMFLAIKLTFAQSLQDGDAPDEKIITRWLSLIEETYKPNGREGTIAVHCVAGLGRYLTAYRFLFIPSVTIPFTLLLLTPLSLCSHSRSIELICLLLSHPFLLLSHRTPVLVAIALIELGMEPLDAAMFVRSKRRGAINAKQLKFLETYKRRSKKKKKKGNGGGCLIQ